AIGVSPGRPQEVIFSAPTEDETDVMQNSTVRIQFSRDLDPATLKGRVRVQYAGAQSAGPAAASLDFTTNYNGANRVVEIRFAKPLERFRTVKVDLLGGKLGHDRQTPAP